jgi:hypothetical protein
VAPGQCNGLSLTCTGTANCSGGEVCCGSLIGGGATCEPSCNGGYQLCQSDSDCPSGDSCKRTLFGIDICRPAHGGGGGGGGGGGVGTGSGIGIGSLDAGVSIPILPGG